MDDDIIAKILVAIVVIGAVIFDWPRALAGFAIGFAGRRMRYSWIVIAVGVVLVAAAGEVIYAAIGRTSGMSWGTMTWGLIAAGAGAVGFFRMLGWIANDVEAP